MMKIKEIEKKIRPLAKKYGAKRIALFGSTARGTMRPDSDIDLLIDLPNKHMSLLDFVDLKTRMEKKLARKIDLVEYKTLKPQLRTHVLNEQVILYDKKSKRVS